MPPPMLLNDGTEMPQIAYGLYQVPKEDAARCVADAVKAGYAHFDGAAFYDNEREAGRSPRRSAGTRRRSDDRFDI